MGMLLSQVEQKIPRNNQSLNVFTTSSLEIKKNKRQSIATPSTITKSLANNLVRYPNNALLAPWLSVSVGID